MDQIKDLTAMAKSGKLNPVIERDDEVLSRCIRFLRRKTQNNLLLIGDIPKTAIYHGLAQRISEEDVPRELKNRKLIYLDMIQLWEEDVKCNEKTTGVKWTEEFVDRLNNVCNHVIAGHNILIMDNYFPVTNSMDVGELLKPMLGHGKLQCIIGTGSFKFEYYIEKDRAFECQFQQVFMDQAIDEAAAYTRPQAFDEIRKAISRLKSKNDILLNDSDSEMDFTTYLVVRRLGKKISELQDVEYKLEKQWEYKMTILKRVQLLNEEIDKVKHKIKRAQQNCCLNLTIKQKYESLTSLERRRQDTQLLFKGHKLCEDYKELVNDSRNSIFEGVPRRTMQLPRPMPEMVTHLQKLGKHLQLEDKMHKHLVGQDHAVKAVVQAIRGLQAGFSNPHHPMASFMFMGPTGVGKTLLAEVLAKCLFNDKEALVQFFLGTSSQDNAIQRLIGAPIGYKRSEYGGQLTEPVLKKRHGVILFEDIEKAHPDVNILLRRILYGGRVENVLGQIVDFTNTVVIMTSTNLGSPYIVDTNNGSLTKGKAYKTLRHNVMEAASEIFGRDATDNIDDFIVFRPFDRCHLNQIVRLELDMVQQKLALQKMISIEVTDAAVELLANLAYSPNCSARAVTRVIGEFVETHLAERIEIKEYKNNDTVLIDTEEATTYDDGLVGDNGQLIQHMKFIFKKLGSASLKE